MKRKWENCIVACSGPSLTAEIAEKCRGHRVIAVNDAWQLLPFADVLYGCDAPWWDLKRPSDGEFCGERWTSLGEENAENESCAKRHGLSVVRGCYSDKIGFSFEPGLITYGYSSGHQALNLALQFGAKHVIAVGLDMRKVGDKLHFNGDHPSPLSNPDGVFFDIALGALKRAARFLPDGIRIVNATPGSACTSFPIMTPDEALDDRLHWHQSGVDTRSDRISA